MINGYFRTDLMCQRSMSIVYVSERTLQQAGARPIGIPVILFHVSLVVRTSSLTSYRSISRITHRRPLLSPDRVSVFCARAVLHHPAGAVCRAAGGRHPGLRVQRARRGHHHHHHDGRAGQLQHPAEHQGRLGRRSAEGQWWTMEATITGRCQMRSHLMACREITRG